MSPEIHFEYLKAGSQRVFDRRGSHLEQLLNEMQSVGPSKKGSLRSINTVESDTIKMRRPYTVNIIMVHSFLYCSY